MKAPSRPLSSSSSTVTFIFTLTLTLTLTLTFTRSPDNRRRQSRKKRPSISPWTYGKPRDGTQIGADAELGTVGMGGRGLL